MTAFTRPPPGPAKVLAARQRLLAVCHQHLNATIVGDAFSHFATSMHQEIGTTDFRAVLDSLRSLAGRSLTEEVAGEACWRLAGNLHRLLAGRTVPPWTVQTEIEWVTVQIDSVVKRFRRYKAKTQEQSMQADVKGMVSRAGAIVRYIVLNGLPAGKMFEKFWTTDLCETIKSEFGFDKFNREKFSRNVSVRPPWPFLDVREFYRMRLQVRLEPELCQFGELGFKELRGTSATKAWCRGIMRKRLRDGFACPANYADDFPCHSCPAGLTSCPAACHAEDYLIGRCETCKRDKTHLDPLIDLDTCIECCARRY